jgi:mRNA-degrading endonuclease RelE of RelBE toxin-antitoxin system
MRVSITPYCLKVIKTLKKKYPHIVQDLNPLIEQLQNGTTPGDQVTGTGSIVYKVRVRNSDIGKGKSGGYRLIYYLRTQDHILLLQIYTKSERENITAQEVRALINDILQSDDY